MKKHPDTDKRFTVFKNSSERRRRLTIIVALACAAGMISPAHAGRELRDSIMVIDGNTVRAQGITVRLIGFDVPARSNGKCAYENELGVKAAELLNEMINHGVSISLQSTGRKDPSGVILGTLTIDGMDIGDMMISEELAVPYNGGRRRSWCP
jgi:micrococcal nuclease